MDIEVSASGGMVRLGFGAPVFLTPEEAHALTTRLVAVLAELAEPVRGPDRCQRPHLVLVASRDAAPSPPSPPETAPDTPPSTPQPG